jgi:hypothetical protein
MVYHTFAMPSDAMIMYQYHIAFLKRQCHEKEGKDTGHTMVYHSFAMACDVMIMY